MTYDELDELDRLLEMISGVSSTMRGKPRVEMTVDEWLKLKDISNYEIEHYPNAATAAKIKASPLGRALE